MTSRLSCEAMSEPGTDCGSQMWQPQYLTANLGRVPRQAVRRVDYRGSLLLTELIS